jgi:ABC-type enterochelin transport system substrate-binding protein
VPKKNSDPLVITVKDGHWNAYGTPGRRSAWLYATLERQGGIAESVEDGAYHYNVTRKGFRLIATLTKIED